MTMINFDIQKKVKQCKSYFVFQFSLLIIAAAAVSSCQNFFDVESDYVIDAKNDHLNNAVDSIYSVTGIMNKMQAIADRTILLGEARGDLVDITSAASKDLRQVALFQIDDNNMYNNPRDYYAIINNCNYFIAKVDTSMVNNRNENIFKKEYAAVKAFRAWTYLQFVITYGEVPFFTEPILNVSDAEVAKYPKKDINAVCDYFLNEDGLTAIADPNENPYPNYGIMKDGNKNSRLYYMPMYIILGDLNLWRGNYLEAAKNYYAYITKRNGPVSSYPTSLNRVEWSDFTWQSYTYSSNWFGSSETVRTDAELIMMIPGDSIPAEGHYSQLRNIFNSNDQNNYSVSLVPSKSLKEISAAQKYCYYFSSAIPPQYPGIIPHNELLNGDLRLAGYYGVIKNQVNPFTNQRQDFQTISKYSTMNTHIYRRTMVYLRLAEALNRAGYPELGFETLRSGLTDATIKSAESTYISEGLRTLEDSAFVVNTFSFPTSGVNSYVHYDPAAYESRMNTQGIHSRGSGYTPQNEYYQMLEYDPALTPEQNLQNRIQYVEDLIMEEEALEFALEGYRFYDLVRVALRRNDPSFLADRVNARKGAGTDAGISVDLKNPDNWFLSWRGIVGRK